MVQKLLIIGWAGALGAGFYGLAKYEFTPGAQRPALPHLARQVPITAMSQLYVFIHPECACSIATLHELQKIQDETHDRLTISVDIVIPSETSTWKATPTAQLATQNRRWQVKFDLSGSFAMKMGAMTSGLAILYDPTGRKVFQGGITGSRGHEGDNPGHDSIVAFVEKGAPTVGQTPIYGCALGSLGATK